MKLIKILSILSLLITFNNVMSQGFVSGALKTIEFDVDSLTTRNLNKIVQGATDADSLKTANKKMIAESWFKVKEIHLYGGGTLLGLVTADTDIEETASPTGSIGINLNTERINFDLYFSYNNKSDTQLTTLGQFGTALINPDLGGHSLSLKALVNMKSYFGFSGSFVIADNIWEMKNGEKIDVSPLIFRIGSYLNLFDFSDLDNKVNIVFDVHYTHRSLLGDFNNSDHLLEDELITGRGYNGFDFTINAYLNSVKVYVQLSKNTTTDFIIPGFSGTQVLFGVDVTGGLIKLK